MGNYRLSDYSDAGEGHRAGRAAFLADPVDPVALTRASPKGHGAQTADPGTEGLDAILSGLGVAPQNTNAGVIAVEMDGRTASYIDDVNFSSGANQDGHEQLLRPVGRRTRRRHVSRTSEPDTESAPMDFNISDTSAPASCTRYRWASSEGGDRAKNVQNWTFNTIQTEEVSGDEKTASMEMEAAKI